MPFQNPILKLSLFPLLMGLVLVAGSPVLAQQQSSQTQTAESEKEETAPIPPGEILPQIEETDNFIRRSKQLADSGFPTDDLNARVLELQNRFELLETRTARRLGGLVPPRLLEDLRSAWEAETATAKSAQKTPARSSKALADLLEHVRLLLERWKLTRAGAVEMGLPAPVVREVEKTIKDLTSLKSSLQDRWVEVISVQEKYSQLLINYDHMIGLIEGRAKETRARLMSLDSPPLWEVFTSDEDQPSTSEQIVETWQTSLGSSAEYLRTYPERLVIQAVVFVILLVIMLAVRRRAREWKDEPSLQGARIALERPVSQALLITVVAGILIHVMAPRALTTLAACLVLIPLVRLIPGLIEPAFRPVVYLLGVLFIIGQLSQLTLSGTSVNRSLITLSILLGLGTCALLLRQFGRKGTQGSRWHLAVRLILQVAAWIFIASLILSVLGAVLLANLLASGLLTSAYLALVFLVATVVIKDSLQVLVRTPTLQRLQVFRNHSDLILRRVSWGLDLISLGLWVLFTLKGFWLQAPFTNAVRTALTASAKLGTIEISLGFVLTFVFTIWLSFLISKFIRFVLKEDIYPRVKLPRGVPGAVSSIAHYVILCIGFVMAFAAAGFDLSRFTLLAGAFGVGLGFGLQNLVNNFVSGLILLFERPIQVGDKVQLGDLFGEVRHIGIRASIVKTWEGAEVIVPNGNLISTEVVNWTLSDQIRRVDVAVGTKYGTDPERVLELLLEVAEKHPNVLSDPSSSALFLGFGDSSLDFSLRAWTGFENYRNVRSELNVEVNRALADAGIEIPFPQRDLHLRSVDPEAKVKISQEQVNRPPEKPKNSED